MKKLKALAIAIFVTALATTTLHAAEISILLNGETVHSEVSPIIIDGRTFVPVRAVSEGLGAEVDWNAQEKKATIKKDSKIIELTLNSDTALINAAPYSLDAPAQIIDGSTMVPMRFVAEGLELDVDWDSKNKIVNLTSKNSDEKVINNKTQNKQFVKQETAKPIQTTQDENKTSENAQYVGNNETNKFHQKNCRFVNKISDENKMFFNSREEATNKGYIPCGVCKP